MVLGSLASPRTLSTPLCPLNPGAPLKLRPGHLISFWATLDLFVCLSTTASLAGPWTYVAGSWLLALSIEWTVLIHPVILLLVMFPAALYWSAWIDPVLPMVSVCCWTVPWPFLGLPWAPGLIPFAEQPCLCCSLTALRVEGLACWDRNMRQDSPKSVSLVLQKKVFSRSRISGRRGAFSEWSLLLRAGCQDLQKILLWERVKE